MKLVGMVLVVLGIVALIYGGIDYNRDKTVLQMGSMSATVTEHKTVAIPAILGVASLVGGLALIFVPRRRLLLQKG
jgi:uncharacterized membrane protein YidH (DUF202 family)